MTPPLKLGILGAARIARLFAAGVIGSPKVLIQAVASRDRARAESFARETGVPNVHASYESLLADESIDAVYNPLPNNLHAAWSIRAAEAGKHVLCEKPFAASADEVRAVLAAAKRNDVYVVEGYPYLAQPQIARLRGLLAEQAIGRLKLVHASFGFPLAEGPNIRLDPGLAGGALMDAGSYPISLVRIIAGERPQRVVAMARFAPSGVDDALVGVLDFAGGLYAQISCSFATARHRRALIVGEGGIIETTYFNDTSPKLPPTLLVRRSQALDAEVESIATPTGSGFRAEAESFHDLVRFGWSHWSGATPEESLDIACIIDALARSAREGVPVEVAA